MARRKNRVTKLSIDEVSLVDSPANPGARVLLAKRGMPSADADKPVGAPVDPGDEGAVKGDECPECGGILRNGTCQSCGYTAFGKSAVLAAANAAYQESLASILADPDCNQLEMFQKSWQEYHDFIAPLLESDEDLEDETLTEQEDTMAKNESGSESVIKGLSDDQQKAVEERIAKSVDAAVKLAVEAISKRAEETEKQLNETRSELAKRDRLAKAKTMVGKTALDAEKVAKVLEKIEGDKEVSDFLADTIAKYEKAMEAGKLLKEIGASVPELGGDDEDAETFVNKAVDEIRKANPKLTKEQAYAEALARNPGLYEALSDIDSDNE